MFPPDFSPDEGQRDKTYEMFACFLKENHHFY